MIDDNHANHDTRIDIEVTLRPGIQHTVDGDEVRCWFVEADGYQTGVADSPREALALIGEQVENDADLSRPSLDSEPSTDSVGGGD